MTQSFEVTPELKALLSKMLALEPTQRVPLSTLQREDPWITRGPNGYRMTMADYKETMDRCYEEIQMELFSEKDNGLLPLLSNEDPTADASH